MDRWGHENFAMSEDLSYPLSVDTLGKLIALGMGAWGWCPTCRKGRDIDLDKLAATLGHGWKINVVLYPRRVRRPVKCRDCGARLEVRLVQAPLRR
jgi:hypothetical protein